MSVLLNNVVPIVLCRLTTSVQSNGRIAMKKIQLGGHIGRGGIKGWALVDDEDYEELNKYSWCIGSGGYAITVIKNVRTILMHRLILNAKKGEEIDHKFGNKLDNRKSKLRFCTRAENTRNQGLSKANTTGAKGIDQLPSGRWRAKIKVGPKRIHIGVFPSKLDASRAYNNAATKYHGKFARLNVIKR